MNNKKLSKLLLLTSIVISISILSYHNSKQNPIENEVNKDNTTQITEVNPIEHAIIPIKEDSPPITDVQKIDDNITQMKDKVLNYLGNESEYIGLVYYDLINNKGFEINKDIDYRSASTAKLFTVMCLYDYVHNNKIDINEEMYYIGNDYEGGTGIMQGMNLNRAYTLKELADYSIKNSDNIAFNMILRYIGYNNVINYYEEIIGHEIGSPITMSASNGTKLLMKIYENKENNPYYETLINNLKDTDFKNRIEQYLPIYSVAHKIGSYEGNIHDIGIVYGNNTYILSIFTNGLSDAENKIADISKIIYDLN